MLSPLSDKPATPKPTKSKKVRQSNPERSARTREKLLNATIDCLYRLGYHQTSTVTVTKVAGVSRGAMLHQFPSKADLMMATSEHISRLRGEAHRLGREGVTDDRERFALLIDILWKELKSPSGVARIEIMLASRSDPEFGARFVTLNEDLEHRHKEAVWSLADRLGFKNRKLSDAMVQLYAAALRGLAIDYLQPSSRPDIEAAVELLKSYQMDLLDRTAGKVV
ncbi:hypothetical protein BH11PSE2_BH11PSE2_08280 [soil metagenome]